MDGNPFSEGCDYLFRGMHGNPFSDEWEPLFLWMGAAERQYFQRER